MNATAIAAALSERAEVVCRAYLPGGRRHGRYWIAGDVAGRRGRSLWVRLAAPGQPGKWTDAATGEHGDLLDIIRRRHPTMRQALDEARVFLALKPAQLLPAAAASCGSGSYDAAQTARRIWNLCCAIDGTHGEAYLRARGLAHCRFPCLRFHSALRYRDGPSVRHLPAVVAAVTDNDGRVTGIHRTWLDPRSPVKAYIPSPRKALGQIYGHAVRFGAPDTTLLIGEGIETVLSAIATIPAVNAAAALSAGSLAAFALPPGVRHVVIAQDSDSEGERAAVHLARRCAQAGVAATVVVSQAGDFNDDLLEDGPEAIATRIAPLLRSTE